VHFTRFFPFLEILENAVPCDTLSVRELPEANYFAKNFLPGYQGLIQCENFTTEMLSVCFLQELFTGCAACKDLFSLARNLKRVLPSAVSRIKIAHSKIKALTSFETSFSICFVLFFAVKVGQNSHPP